jgi:hypothetical protein
MLRDRRGKRPRFIAVVLSLFCLKSWACFATLFTEVKTRSQKVKYTVYFLAYYIQLLDATI